MNSQTLIIIIQCILGLGVVFVYYYIRALPTRINDSAIKNIEFKLDKQLEEFKASLNTELELQKISQSELQIHKTKELVRLIEYFNDHIFDKHKQERIHKNTSEMQKFQKNMLDLGVKLFFFASDPTIKKYIEWRKLSQKPKDEVINSQELLTIYGDLIVEIRKDLGYKDTKCNHDDFLSIILNDWYKIKKQYNV